MSMTQGIGSTYETRCSAKMTLDGDEYKAACTPAQCIEGFIDAGVSHQVVAIDPGKKVVGSGVRACILDMSQIGLIQQEHGIEITPKDQDAE
jgi:hypothetical protein